MPAFDFSDFAGMIPRLHPAKLPPGAAAMATDCNLMSRALSPLAIGAPPPLSLNNGTILPGLVPESEVVAIPAPGKITFAQTTPICQPFTPPAGGAPWLEIQAYAWYGYWLGTGLVWTSFSNLLDSSFLTFSRFENYDTGIKLYYTLRDTGFVAYANVAYKVVGPRFRFIFRNDVSARGGPSISAAPGFLAFPDTARYTDPIRPGWRIPLWRNGQIYADARLRDIDGPAWDRDDLSYADTGHDAGGNVIATPSTYHNMDGGQVVFDLGLEFSSPARKVARFVQTLRDAAGHESPASEPSDLIQVCPGDILTLSTPTAPSTWPAGGERLLYCSGSQGGEDWLLLDEIKAESATWTENGQIPKADVLPELGLYTASAAAGTSDEEKRAAFLENSLVHPSQFGVAFVSNAGVGELWFSDVTHYSAWPKKWVMPVTEIVVALAMAGDTILVFTETRTYALQGSHPQNMTLRVIDENYPLLSKLSLFKLGGRVGWVSADGLVLCDGASVTLATKDHYTRTGWQALAPSSLACRTAGGAVLIEGTGGNATRLLFIPDGGPAALVKFTDAGTIHNPVWESGVLSVDQPLILDSLLVQSDAAADVTIATTSDLGAVTSHTFSLAKADCGKPYQLSPSMGPSRVFQFTFTLHSVDPGEALRSASFFERRILDVAAEGITLTAENVADWGNVWLKFADAGRFVAGMLSVADNTPCRLHFADRTGADLFHLDVTSGRAFQIKHAANVPLELCRVRITQAAVDSSGASLPLTAPVVSLVLRTRVTTDIGHGLREIFDSTGIPPWWTKNYKLADRAALHTFRANHRKVAPVNLAICDPYGAETDVTDLVSGIQQHRPRLFLSAFTMDFGGADDCLVDEVIITVDAAEAIAGAIQITDPTDLLACTYAAADGAELGAVAVSAPDYSSPPGYNTPGVRFTARADNAAAALSGSPLVLVDGNYAPLPRAWGQHYLWEFDIEAATSIYGATVLPRQVVPLAAEGIYEQFIPGQCPPNLVKRYRARDIFQPTSAIVRTRSGSYGGRTINFYKNASIEATVTAPLVDGREFLLPTAPATLGDVHDLEYGLVDGAGSSLDHDLLEVCIFGRNVMAIPEEGLVNRSAESVRNWLGRVLEFKKIGSFSGLRIVATDYTHLSVTLSTGTFTWTQLFNAGPIDVRLPVSLPDAKQWTLSISFQGVLNEVHLYGRLVHDLSRAGLVRVTQDMRPLTWTGMRVRAPRPECLVAGRVDASPEAYPVTSRLWTGDTLTVEQTITGNAPFWLPKTNPETIREWDLVTNNGAGVIYEASLATSRQLLRN